MKSPANSNIRLSYAIKAGLDAVQSASQAMPKSRFIVLWPAMQKHIIRVDQDS